MEKLCERIYALRKSAGLSQEELAHKTGVSRQTISKWESGTMVPESSNLRSLCLLFDVSADYLLFGKEADPVKEPAEEPVKAVAEQTDKERRSAQETEDLRYKQALYLCAAIFMGALTLLSLAVTGVASYLLLAGIPLWQGEQNALSLLFSPAVLLGVSLFFSIMLATFTVLIGVAFLRTRKKLKA